MTLGPSEKSLGKPKYRNGGRIILQRSISPLYPHVLSTNLPLMTLTQVIEIIVSLQDSVFTWFKYGKELFIFTYVYKNFMNRYISKEHQPH